jgi:hypothetical protein
MNNLNVYYKNNISLLKACTKHEKKEKKFMFGTSTISHLHLQKLKNSKKKFFSTGYSGTTSPF